MRCESGAGRAKRVACKAISVARIAKELSTTWRGDPDMVVSGVAALVDAGHNDLSLYSHPRYRNDALKTRACVVLVHPDEQLLHEDRVLRVPDPQAALRRVIHLLMPEEDRTAVRHSSACVDPSAAIHETVSIDAYVTIGADTVIAERVHVAAGARISSGVTIGSDTRIGSNAVIMDGVTLGRGCVIGPGTVIGSVGFGFTQEGGRAERIPHIGTVILEDRVELGANCTVDRGTLGATRIGAGTKIDNLVHVAHNVTLGRNLFIAAQCGIAGSSSVGDGVMMGGQAGVSGHIDVPAGTVVGAKAGVMKSYSSAPKEPVTGMPARPVSKQRESQAALSSLPALREKVRRLENEIEELRRRES